jgi:hypothetical protein
MADEEPTPPEERLSPRERRAQRAQAKQSTREGVNWRRYRVHFAIVLVWALIIGGVVANERFGRDCPGHWHAIMDIQVNGEPISFAHPKFTLEGTGQTEMALSIHMHQGEVSSGRNQWHFEPPQSDCVPFEDALRLVDIELSSDRIAFSGPGHEALGQTGTFTENATHTLSAYHKQYDGDWSRIGVSRLDGRQPPTARASSSCTATTRTRKCRTSRRTRPRWIPTLHPAAAAASPWCP